MNEKKCVNKDGFKSNSFEFNIVTMIVSLSHWPQTLISFKKTSAKNNKIISYD